MLKRARTFDARLPPFLSILSILVPVVLSGYAAAGRTDFSFSKDLDRFSKLALYREGWNDGNAQCRSKQVERNNVMRAQPTTIYVPSKSK